MMRALGLMSGTSLDGIDVALLETDGERRIVPGPFMSFPYTREQRATIAEALAHARFVRSRHERPGNLPMAERMITELHASAVSAFLRKTRIARESVDVIGFHGQTVLHKPEDGLTVQLGLPELLAEYANIPVVADLRIADIDGGGQGAPLAPVYHWALAGSAREGSTGSGGDDTERRTEGEGGPIAFLNVGGVANVTFVGRPGVDGTEALVAFDTGPGNALIDDWMLKHTDKAHDPDGAYAARGNVHENVVQFYANHDYFAKAPPKSLDRNTFFWDMMDWMSVDDGAATLTACTAEAVARALTFAPIRPGRIIVTGGGRHNGTLMAMLGDRLGIEVVAAEAAGFNGDAVEAQAWAYLAVRSVKGLDITFPGTTGIAKPMTGGRTHQPPYEPSAPFIGSSG